MTMVVAIRVPDEGFYELSFTKTFYKGKARRMGASLHSNHLARVIERYRELGKAAPVMSILGHHPAFNLGVLVSTPYGNDDYATIGGFLDDWYLPLLMEISFWYRLMQELSLKARSLQMNLKL